MEQYFVNSQNSDNENRHLNLNLSQNYECAHISPIQSHSKQYKDSTVSYEKKITLKSWNLNPPLNTPNFETMTGRSEEVSQKRWKKSGCSSLSSSITNSTLSIHIAAFENSFARASDSINGRKNEEFEKTKTWSIIKKQNAKQVFTASTFFIQNPFEFPRQQNDKVTEPELSQFKASQRLFNSNEASNGGQQKNVDQKMVEESKKKAAPEGEKKLKPCCVCLETKKARDECVLLNGEEHCSNLIEAHKKCLRDLGFEI